MGWFGAYGQLKYALKTYGLDTDKDDNPMTAIEDERGIHEPSPAQGIAFFLGMLDDTTDVVVPDNVRAFKDGKPAGTVAAYMNATSYGVRNIVVIG